MLLDLWSQADTPSLLQTALPSKYPDDDCETLAEHRFPRGIRAEVFPSTMQDSPSCFKNLNGAVSPQDQKHFLFLHATPRNLADFVREFTGRDTPLVAPLFPKKTPSSLSKLPQTARRRSPWSESTIRRVSSYLLGACADFGMLGPDQGWRALNPNLQADTFHHLLLAHDLHFKGFGDNAVPDREDWGLFGLDSGRRACRTQEARPSRRTDFAIRRWRRKSPGRTRT